MKRTVYEAPVTELFRVELEGTFMSASAEVENPQGTQGEIVDQQINDSFKSDNFNSDWE